MSFPEMASTRAHLLPERQSAAAPGEAKKGHR